MPLPEFDQDTDFSLEKHDFASFYERWATLFSGHLIVQRFLANAEN